MSWIGVGIAGASILMQGFGMAKSSSASKQLAKQQRRAAEFNATILEGNADEVLKTAQVNAQVADYNAKVIAASGKFNEGLALQSADAVELQGQSQAKKIRQQGARVEGAQAVAYSGAANVMLTGTALDVMKDSAILNTMDALTTIYNSMMEARSIRAEAINIRRKTEADVYNTETQKAEIIRKAEFDAANLKKQAQLQLIAGQVTADATLAQGRANTISGMANIANTFYNGYQSGMFSGGNRVNHGTLGTSTSGVGSASSLPAYNASSTSTSSIPGIVQ